MKYLPPVRRKMSPKLGMLKIYRNLAHLIFQVCRSILMSKIICKKYLPLVRPKVVPGLKMLRIYWNLANLIFRISRSWFRYQRLFLSDIYHKILSTFNFRTTSDRTGGKYLMKIIFDIKIEIGLFEIWNVLNFNKFWVLLLSRLIWAEQVVNVW